MRRVVPIIALLGLLACGGGSKAPAAQSSTPTSKLGGYQTAHEVVDAMREHGLTCSGLQASDPSQLYTREDATCEIDGEVVNVLTFADAGRRDQFLEAAKAFGGVYDVGDTWVVSCDTELTCVAVRSAIGGALQS